MTSKLSPRDQLIAAGVGALVVLALSFFFLIKPQFNKIATLRTEQGAQEEQLEQARLKLQRLEAVKQEAIAIEAKRIVLSRRMPEDPEVPSLLIELEKVADQADIKVVSMGIGKKEDQTGYAQMGLTFSGTGKFYNVVDFLYRLEKMTREIKVDNISLSPSDYPGLSVTIAARAFTLAKGAGAAPAPSQSASGTPAPAGAAGQAAQAPTAGQAAAPAGGAL